VQLTALRKGRVERAHLTLQDRLVKEMRLRGISTIVEANVYAPSFMAAYNARFAKPPKSDFDAHRPLRGDYRTTQPQREESICLRKDMLQKITQIH
jgi:hypothetical protein